MAVLDVLLLVSVAVTYLTSGSFLLTVGSVSSAKAVEGKENKDRILMEHQTGNNEAKSSPELKQLSKRYLQKVLNGGNASHRSVSSTGQQDHINFLGDDQVARRFSLMNKTFSNPIVNNDQIDTVIFDKNRADFNQLKFVVERNTVNKKSFYAHKNGIEDILETKMFEQEATGDGENGRDVDDNYLRPQRRDGYPNTMQIETERGDTTIFKRKTFRSTSTTTTPITLIKPKTAVTLLSKTKPTVMVTSMSKTNSTTSVTPISKTTLNTTATPISKTQLNTTVTPISKTTLNTTATPISKTQLNTTVAQISKTQLNTTATPISKTQLHTTVTQISKTQLNTPVTQISKTQLNTTATPISVTKSNTRINHKPLIKPSDTNNETMAKHTLTTEDTDSGTTLINETISIKTDKRTDVSITTSIPISVMRTHTNTHRRRLPNTIITTTTSTSLTKDTEHTYTNNLSFTTPVITTKVTPSTINLTSTSKAPTNANDHTYTNRLTTTTPPRNAIVDTLKKRLTTTTKLSRYVTDHTYRNNLTTSSTTPTNVTVRTYTNDLSTNTPPTDVIEQTYTNNLTTTKPTNATQHAYKNNLTTTIPTNDNVYTYTNNLTTTTPTTITAHTYKNNLSINTTTPTTVIVHTYTNNLTTDLAPTDVTVHADINDLRTTTTRTNVYVHTYENILTSTPSDTPSATLKLPANLTTSAAPSDLTGINLHGMNDKEIDTNLNESSTADKTSHFLKTAHQVPTMFDIYNYFIKPGVIEEARINSTSNIWDTTKAKNTQNIFENVRNNPSENILHQDERKDKQTISGTMSSNHAVKSILDKNKKINIHVQYTIDIMKTNSNNLSSIYTPEINLHKTKNASSAVDKMKITVSVGNHINTHKLYDLEPTEIVKLRTAPNTSSISNQMMKYNNQTTGTKNTDTVYKVSSIHEEINRAHKADNHTADLDKLQTDQLESNTFYKFIISKKIPGKIGNMKKNIFETGTNDQMNADNNATSRVDNKRKHMFVPFTKDQTEGNPSHLVKIKYNGRAADNMRDSRYIDRKDQAIPGTGNKERTADNIPNYEYQVRKNPILLGRGDKEMRKSYELSTQIDAGVRTYQHRSLTVDKARINHYQPTAIENAKRTNNDVPVSKLRTTGIVERLDGTLGVKLHALNAVETMTTKRKSPSKTNEVWKNNKMRRHHIDHTTSGLVEHKQHVPSSDDDKVKLLQKVKSMIASSYEDNRKKDNEIGKVKIFHYTPNIVNKSRIHQNAQSTVDNVRRNHRLHVSSLTNGVRTRFLITSDKMSANYRVPNALDKLGTHHKGVKVVDTVGANHHVRNQVDKTKVDFKETNLGKKARWRNQGVLSTVDKSRTYPYESRNVDKMGTSRYKQVAFDKTIRNKHEVSLVNKLKIEQQKSDIEDTIRSNQTARRPVYKLKTNHTIRVTGPNNNDYRKGVVLSLERMLTTYGVESSLDKFGINTHRQRAENKVKAIRYASKTVDKVGITLNVSSKKDMIERNHISTDTKSLQADSKGRKALIPLTSVTGYANQDNVVGFLINGPRHTIKHNDSSLKHNIQNSVLVSLMQNGHASSNKDVLSAQEVQVAQHRTYTSDPYSGTSSLHPITVSKGGDLIFAILYPKLSSTEGNQPRHVSLFSDSLDNKEYPDIDQKKGSVSAYTEKRGSVSAYADRRKFISHQDELTVKSTEQTAKREYKLSHDDDDKISKGTDDDEDKQLSRESDDEEE